MSAALDAALARIAAAPRGPQVGAFFDFDGTLIDGSSAAAYFVDQIRRGQMGARQVVETARLARKKDLSDAEFGEIIGKGILEWAGRSESQMRAMWKRLWLERVGSTLFPEGWQVVGAHPRVGHMAVIASSATRYQIEPLAEEWRWNLRHRA